MPHPSSDLQRAPVAIPRVDLELHGHHHNERLLIQMITSASSSSSSSSPISTSPTGAVSSDAVAMLPPTTSLSISNFPPSSSRLSSPLVTSLMTSFHHSVCFGDLAIPTVSVVMMTLTTFLAGVMRQAMGMLDSRGEDLSLKLLILFWTSLMISILGCQRSQC